MKLSKALSLILLLWLAAFIVVPLFKLDWLVTLLIHIVFIVAVAVLTIVMGKSMGVDVSRVEVVWRESGPICYSVQIILNSALRASLPGALLASGLNCYWDCSPSRSLTQLTAQSAVLLAEDLDLFARTFFSSITIFGFAQEADNIVANSFEDLQPLLRFFSVHEAGPLAIVIVQEGDDVFEAVFVAHNPTTAVRYLLEVWGVSKETISHTHCDSNIRGAFEKLFDLPPRNLISIVIMSSQMNLIPYSHFFLHSKFSPDDVREQLNRNVRPQSWLNFLAPDKPFSGSVTSAQFRIYRSFGLGLRGGLPPTVTGVIQPDGVESSIEIKMRMNVVSLIIMVGSLVFLSIPNVLLLFPNVPAHIDAQTHCVAFAMMLMVYALFRVGFSIEASVARSFLEELLGSHASS